MNVTVRPTRGPPSSVSKCLVMNGVGLDEAVMVSDAVETLVLGNPLVTDFYNVGNGLHLCPEVLSYTVTADLDGGQRSKLPVVKKEPHATCKRQGAVKLKFS